MYYSLSFVISLILLATRGYTATPLAVSAGYHVIYSYSGTSVPPALSNYVAQGRVGGVILFGENIDDTTPRAMADLQSTWRKSEFYTNSPLLILTDQEGGEVRRLPGGPDQSEKDIGASANAAGAAKTAGTQAADALKAYNNNGNLAPVADVFRTAGDFEDQNERSYSNDSAVAGDCTSAFVTAQQAGGVVSTLKHFPGLGSAAADENTDERPVTLDASIDELRSVDYQPFAAGITAGTKMVMPSWAVYPSYDADWPAGLSAKWIGNELRGRLGFDGVVVTDAIEAGALRAFGQDPGRRAVLAMQAGQDLILAANGDPEQGSDVVDALVESVGNGTLSREVFDTSSNRILDLRSVL